MDVGRFHRWLSLIILAVALTFSAGGVLAWWNRPGEWLLVIAAGISAVLLWLDVRDARKNSGNETDPIKDATPDQWWTLGQGNLTR